jgi:uncharacterized membrane protein YfcA
LVIIAFKAAIGFAQYQQRLMAQDMSVDGQTILTFVLIGVVGSVVGKAVNSRIDQPKLKTVFASFLVVLGAFIVLTEGRKLISAKTSQSVVETATSSTDTKLVLTHDASDSLLATQAPRR